MAHAEAIGHLDWSFPMYTIDINCSSPYRVHIGTMLLEQSGELIRDACKGSRAAVITDTNVGPLYAHIVTKSLAEAGYTTCVHMFEAGEEHKRADTLIEILEFIAENELGRKDVVVALGGGVVGDVAGFAAATYMRGIRFAQIPTSLLAMVDSSVGGKTAIDLAAGKNLAGAFWQPSIVIADVGCLGTLTAEQLSDGCGEIIKHGVICDAALFCQLEQTPLTQELLTQNLGLVAAIIARNIEIKRDVVVADERESGLRKLLNFGHSAGHAIEALEAYQLGHGNCVALGMGIIARAAAARGVCDETVPQRIEDLVRRHGLATSCRWDAEQIFAEALHDKKRQGYSIDVVLPHEIGSCSIETMDLQEFRDFLYDGLSSAANVPAVPDEAPADNDRIGEEASR